MRIFILTPVFFICVKIVVEFRDGWLPVDALKSGDHLRTQYTLYVLEEYFSMQKSETIN